MFPPRSPSYCRNDWVRSFNPKSDFAFQLNFLFVCQISYIIAVSTLKTGPRYFSLFLMLGGLFGSYNVALAVSTFTLLISVLVPSPLFSVGHKKTNFANDGHSGSLQRSLVLVRSEQLLMQSSTVWGMSQFFFAVQSYLCTSNAD